MDSNRLPNTINKYESIGVTKLGRLKNSSIHDEEEDDDFTF